MPSPSLTEHVLLTALSNPAQRILRAESELIELAAEELLFEPDQPLDRIWFLRSGLVSLVTLLQDGQEVDGITVGRGGALGLPTSLGSHRAISRAAVTVAGEAWTVSGEACRRAMALDEAFSHRLMRYYEAVFAAAVQTSACNAAHTLGQRVCRFLLTCRDQLGSDELPLRQEFVSRMLGVNRTSVTPVSRALQAEGAITVRHGRIHIRSVERLRNRTCACYAATSARFRTLG